MRTKKTAQTTIKGDDENAPLYIVSISTDLKYKNLKNRL